MLYDVLYNTCSTLCYMYYNTKKYNKIYHNINVNCKYLTI